MLYKFCKGNYVILFFIYIFIFLLGCNNTENIPTAINLLSENQSLQKNVLTEFSQVTNSPENGYSAYPGTNANGNMVVFESNLDLVQGSNSNRTQEIFLINTSNGDIKQLSFTNNGSCFNPDINGSGNKVVFGSDADLIAGENDDHNGEIFCVNSDGSGLIQLTHTEGQVNVASNHFPALDHTGKRISFVSGLDLLPGQNNDGGTEIFLINSDGTGLRQLTSTPEYFATNHPCFDGSGRHVLFLSNYDFVGSNSDWNSELFMVDLDGNNIVQITNTTGHGMGGGDKISSDAAGHRIVLTGNFDLGDGLNDDYNQEIFVYEVKSTFFWQLTFTEGGRGCFAPSITANGKTVAFSSDRDLVGTNTDLDTEIFLAQLSK